MGGNRDDTIDPAHCLAQKRLGGGDWLIFPVSYEQSQGTIGAKERDLGPMVERKHRLVRRLPGHYSREVTEASRIGDSLDRETRGQTAGKEAGGVEDHPYFFLRGSKR
jgi:hypothetical protein